MRLSQYHPVLYKASIFFHRYKRLCAWYFGSNKYAKKIEQNNLPIKIFQHQSILLRKLGEVDMKLQYNKVKNLILATKSIDGILIKPGETFSLWKQIGEPTKKRGFLEGLLISNGNVTSGIGGGLCQLANLLYWMFLHTPLQVTERHHHSMDIFPDSGRVLPFGTGATIFYNYIDLQCKNITKQTFQIKLEVTDTHLKGEIFSVSDIPQRYSILERDHKYLYKKSDGQFYRANKIFRVERSTYTGERFREELLMENFSRMKYSPPTEALVQEIP